MKKIFLSLQYRQSLVKNSMEEEKSEFLMDGKKQKKAPTFAEGPFLLVRSRRRGP